MHWKQITVKGSKPKIRWPLHQGYHRLRQKMSRDDGDEKPRQIGLLNAAFPFVMADPLMKNFTYA